MTLRVNGCGLTAGLVAVAGCPVMASLSVLLIVACQLSHVFGSHPASPTSSTYVGGASGYCGVRLTVSLGLGEQMFAPAKRRTKKQTAKADNKSDEKGRQNMCVCVGGGVGWWRAGSYQQ
jgi:hypothetical protein